MQHLVVYVEYCLVSKGRALWSVNADVDCLLKLQRFYVKEPLLHVLLSVHGLRLFAVLLRDHWEMYGKPLLLRFGTLAAGVRSREPMLSVAVCSGRMEAVALTLSMGDTKLDKNTVLALAVYRRDRACVRLLLEKGGCKVTPRTLSFLTPRDSMHQLLCEDLQRPGKYTQAEVLSCRQSLQVLSSIQTET